MCVYIILYIIELLSCGVAPVYITEYSGENNIEIFSRGYGEESNNRPGMRNELAFAYFKVIPSCTYIITFQMRDGHINWKKLQFSILNFGKVIKQRERKRESWRKRRERVTRRPRAAGAAAAVCALAPGRILAFVKLRGTELGSSVSYLVPYASCPALLRLVLLCFARWLLSLVVTSFLTPVLLSARSE